MSNCIYTLAVISLVVTTCKLKINFSTLYTTQIRYVIIYCIEYNIFKFTPQIIYQREPLFFHSLFLFIYIFPSLYSQNTDSTGGIESVLQNAKIVLHWRKFRPFIMAQ